MDTRTLRHLIIMKTGLRTRYVDELLDEALSTDDEVDGQEILKLAREHVSSIRLSAHLVAAYFGENEPMCSRLRALHVEKSDEVDAVEARCEGAWTASKTPIH